MREIEDARETLVEGIVFGEAPRWHDGRFWFSDIGAGRVHRVSADGTLESIVEVPGRPSGLGWGADGRLLVVSMHEHRLMRLSGNALEPVADLSSWCGGDANDMVVDAEGRAYIGNIGFDLDVQPIDPKPTHVVRVDPDGSARSVAADVMAPNGMVISPDGRTLILAESGAARLTAFDIDAAGDLGNRRIFAGLEGGVAADGICLDAEGAVWVASPTTCEFLRVLEGGRVTDRIDTNGRPAIACMLGGPERKTLHLVTAATASIRSSLSRRDGRIETVRVAIPGSGRP